jgi:type I restriction enzyme S subunit
MTVKKLGEISNIRRGASPRPIDDPKYFGGDVGWVRIADVTASKKFLRQTTQYVSKLGEQNSVRVDRGDLILSICGTIGRPMIVDIPACIHDGFVQVYDLKNTDKEYLYYHLQFSEEALKSQGQSGTQTNVNTTLVGNLDIYHPSVSEQQQIAAILSRIDQAIEQTESLIAKQQRVKAGLMHDLLTKGIDEHGNIRSEATHEFKDSPLGRIPVEWIQGHLGNQFTLQRGFDITQEQQKTGNIPVVSSSGITSYHSEAKVEGPGVVIGRKGKLGQAYYLDGLFWPHDTSLWVKDFHGNHPRFAAYFLEWLRLDRFDAATSVPTLNRNFIHPMTVAIPLPNEQALIAKAIDGLVSSFTAEANFLEKLKSLKTGLMQDLLTGKVPVTPLLET